VAASVTPRRHDAGPTVLDEHRQARACGSAASLGGDVAGTHQIPVSIERTVWAAKLAASGLGDPPLAGRAGGGGAPLIHQPHHDPGPFGLVAQGLEQVGAAPPPQPEVLNPTRIFLSDALEVADHQRPDPPLHGVNDDLLGGLCCA